MIKSFRCRDTQAIFERRGSKRFRSIQHVALRKLVQLEGAEKLEDLKIPPANCLEKLRRDREGQYSIRINQQWRICFEWRVGCAYNIEIVDYR